MTVIIKCHCKHKQQDRMYGLQSRVHNEMAEKKGWRCTVCGNVKSYNVKILLEREDLQ